MKKIKFEDVEELVHICVSLMFIPSPPDSTGGRTITSGMVSTYRNDMRKILNFLGYTSISLIYSTLRYKKKWTNKYLKIAGVSSKLEWLSESVGIYEWDEWYKETLEHLKEFMNETSNEFSLGNFQKIVKTIGIRLE